MTRKLQTIQRNEGLSRRDWMGQATALGAASLWGLSSGALAQSAYPNRPIKLMVPWPPGQATDLAARVLGQELS
ncbi:MAG: hypothetical protein EBV21_12685, partial [Betaproteobacteria bacterium]|nr:hypothetical protein [Betaproteobacteria bacterium]